MIGYATVRGRQEPGQWVPLGPRRVERVLPEDLSPDHEARGIHFVLVDSDGLGLLGMTIGDRMNRFNGTVIATQDFEEAPGDTLRDYLVRLNPQDEK